MSIDEVTRASKARSHQLLRSSLLVTHNLTMECRTAGDFIVHRMNDVLRAIVDSNFGASSLDKVGALYAAIGVVQPQMVDNTQNLTLLHLSRSFAVVMEEAIVQIGAQNERKKKSNSENDNNNKIEPKDICQMTAARSGAASVSGASASAPLADGGAAQQLLRHRSKSVGAPLANGKSGGAIAQTGARASRVATKKQKKDSWQLPAAGSSVGGAYGRPPRSVFGSCSRSSSCSNDPKDSWQVPVAGTGAYGRPPPSILGAPVAPAAIDK